jgi:hypothetical protein
MESYLGPFIRDEGKKTMKRSPFVIKKQETNELFLNVQNLFVIKGGGEVNSLFLLS